MRSWGLPFIIVGSIAAAVAAAGADTARDPYAEGSGRYPKGPYPADDTAAALHPTAPVEPFPVPSAGEVLRKSSAAARAQAVNIGVTPSAATVDLYKPLIVAINFAANYTNPYDQSDIKVDLIATAPSGANIVLPCFFKSGTTAASVWEARFTPREVGSYSYKITLLSGGATSTSADQTLQVNAAANDGFLHMDSSQLDNVKGWFQFRFDSGKPFRGVGENFGWESGKYTFDYMYGLLKQNNVNFVRTWKGPGSFYLEFGTGKAGWYSPDTAARIDKNMDLAAQDGIYVMPAIDPVVQYQNSVDGWTGKINWQTNPYSTYKGGPCALFINFFTDAKPKAIYKNRLRYMVARWGYSTYVAAWELWNEVDWAYLTDNVPIQTIADWHNEMASYLRSIDPYNHIVTTSLSHNDFAPLWSLKNMDFTQRHLYGSTEQFLTFTANYETNYKKPFVSGEFSLDWQGTTQHPHADYAKELHLGLWRGMFSPTPILPLTWWWDYHADNNDYYHFARAREFSDYTLENSKGVFNLSATAPANVEIHALKSDRGVFVWLYNKNAGAQTNFQVHVTGVTNAAYDYKSYDTWNGGYTNPTVVTVGNGQADMTVANLAGGGDVALWLADRTPVVRIASRDALPEGWSAAFDVASHRLSLTRPEGLAESARYSFADLSGRMLAAGEIATGGHAGTVSRTIDVPSPRAGVYCLKVAVGNRSVTHRVVLSGR